MDDVKRAISMVLMTVVEEIVIEKSGMCVW